MRGRLHHGHARGTVVSASEIPRANGLNPFHKHPTKGPVRLKRGGAVKGKKPKHRLDRKGRGVHVPKTPSEQAGRKLKPFKKGGMAGYAEGGAIAEGDDAVNKIERRADGGYVTGKPPGSKRPRHGVRDEDEGSDTSVDDFPDQGEARRRGGGIHIKKSHKGLLHKDTGTPAGQKIPIAKIKAAEHSDNPKVRRRAQFADNAKDFHH